MSDQANTEAEGKYVSPERRAEMSQSKRLLDKRKVTKGMVSLEEQRERDEVARKNKTALLALLYEYPEIFLPRSGFDQWRPTTREIGTITGIWESVEILCTDGLVAWFINHDPDRENEILVGHIQHFSGEVSTLYSCQSDKPIKERANKPRKPRETLLSRALALLSCNVRKNEQDEESEASSASRGRS